MSLTSAIPAKLKRSVILFPGQGSQYVGMSRDLCDKAKSLFQIANQVLGYDLLKLCNEGPEEELNRTIHSQPAIFVSSLASIENLAQKSKGAVENCVATAGFSLGEFTALTFTQSIDFVDALRLVKLRAEVTQRLSDEVPSGLMSVIYGNNGNIEQACNMAKEYCIRSGMGTEESVCSIASHLFPHGKVIGGHQKALDFVQHNGSDFGIRRMKRLQVSGAFHTSLMKGAEEDLSTALSKINIKEPAIPVYSNLTAQVHENPASIKAILVKHVSAPVRWNQLINNLYTDIKPLLPEDEEVPVTFECGPQDGLTNILGMINLKAKKSAFNIE